MNYASFDGLNSYNANDIITDTLEVTETATFARLVSHNTTLDGPFLAETLTQVGSHIIDQSDSNGINLLSHIALNDNSNIELQGTSSILQIGTTALNELTNTDFTGSVNLLGNLTQISGDTILLDTSVGNISMDNSSISQLGVVSNVLKDTTITNLTVTNSLVLPSNISVPGSTYNNSNISMTGSAIISQSGTGTNVLKTTNLSGDLILDENLIMTDASAFAILKETTVVSLISSGDITQTAGFLDVKSVICNDIDMNDNSDLSMSGSGVIQQTGTGHNSLKDTEITNLTVLDSLVLPSTFEYPHPEFTIGDVEDLDYGETPYVTITGTNSNIILNFGLERGQNGADGADGADGLNGTNGTNGTNGSNGTNGTNGTNGLTPSIAIGTVTSLPHGNTATASITGTTPTLTLNLGLVTGATGANGSNGSNGSNGAKGDKGDKGDDGTNGDSSAATAAAVAAGVSAGVAAAAATAASVSAAAAAASAATAVGSLGIIEADISTLKAKTVYQTAGTVYTRFSSEVQISNGVSNTITLDPFGESAFSNDVMFHDKARVAEDLTCDATTITNNLFIGNNLSSNLKFGNTTDGWRNAGIESIPPVINPLEENDLGTLSLKAKNIYVGAADSDTSVYLNGTVFVDKAAVFQDDVQVQGALQLEDTLYTTGIADFQDNVFMRSDLTVDNGSINAPVALTLEAPQIDVGVGAGSLLINVGNVATLINVNGYCVFAYPVQMEAGNFLNMW